MRKTLSKPETHIVMRVDREAGVIDLRVFAVKLRLQKRQSSALRTFAHKILREVASLLTQRLQFEDLLARQHGTSSSRPKKMKRKTVPRASGVGHSVKSNTPQQYIDALDRAGLIDLIAREIVPGK